MRRLLSREYFPCGSQYYRAPSPDPADWDRDLAHLAALGFNTVKFWVQWRWNAPQEGEYRFEDIDRLMDLAGAHGLRVMLNTIVDVAPGWVYQKYPDVSMLTLDGRRIGPQVQPHRQIGGLGVCFNHAPAMEHMFDFIRTTVRRYRDHSALEIWNVASEPELTSSMAELRLYAADAAQMRDMLCYCDRCKGAFKEWLAAKYGDIGKLNRAWNRNYRGFADVEIPTTRNSFNDVIDWRMFFVHTLGENVRRRFVVAREEDRGKHPLMCHHVFIQGFPVTSTANDPWNVGQFGDLHGITQMDDPMMCDVLRSCAKGRPVMSAEMLMLFGYTLDLPVLPSADAIKRHVFTGIAANLKGFIFWQYRPETLAREAPAWGLTHLDGSETPWLRDYAAVNSVLQRHASFLLDAVPGKAEVALLYSPENQVFGWAATGSEKTVTDSLLGVHAALYRSNIIVDFVHPREIEAGALGHYKVIYMPVPYFLTPSLCEALEKWVANGGVLVGEAYFGGWDVDRGRHQTTIPGYGLHRVFGVRQSTVRPTDPAGAGDIRITVNLPHIRCGQMVYGALVRESYLLEGAEAFGTFSDGAPAVTHASHGKGHAFLIGSYVGLQVHRSGYETNAGLITSLVTLKADVSRPVVTGNGRIRVDVLTGPAGRAMLIARNLEPTSAAADILLPDLSPRAMTEAFTGEAIQLSPAAGGAEVHAEFRAEEVKVYFG